MISNIVLSGAPGSFQATFDSTTLTPSRVYVQVGASSGAYTETDGGDVNGAAANGVQPCIAFLATTLSTFYYTCNVVAADGTVDASAEQSCGVAVPVGGGDGDGEDDGHGHGRGRDHGRGDGDGDGGGRGNGRGDGRGGDRD